MGLRIWETKPTRLMGERLVLAFWHAWHRGAEPLDCFAFAGHFAERFGQGSREVRRSCLIVGFNRAKRRGFCYPKNRANYITTFKRHADYWIRLNRKWPSGFAPFVATISAHPLDAGPYLVFSDWLEERGDRRAEILRTLFC